MRQTSHRTFGFLTVITHVDHEGIAISVFTGAERISELCFNAVWADREKAVTHYVLLRQLGSAGHGLHVLIDMIKQAKQDAAASIPDPASIEQFKESDQRRVTRAGAAGWSLSPAQVQIVKSSNVDGTIYATGGIRWTQLQVIIEKGYADIYRKEGQKVTAIKLNARGMAMRNA